MSWPKAPAGHKWQRQKHARSLALFDTLGYTIGQYLPSRVNAQQDEVAHAAGFIHHRLAAAEGMDNTENRLEGVALGPPRRRPVSGLVTGASLEVKNACDCFRRDAVAVVPDGKVQVFAAHAHVDHQGRSRLCLSSGGL